MEYIHGQVLWAYWQCASAKSKEILRCQLKALIQELRSVPNPVPAQVSGPVGGPIYDYRYTRGMEEWFGPFGNIHDFHLWLRCGFTSPFSAEGSTKPDRNAQIGRMIQLQDRRQYETKLTHGNFNSLNILIKDDKIVGIIDWEMTGWYPDYWEFTSAWHVKRYVASKKDVWR